MMLLVSGTKEEKEGHLFMLLQVKEEVDLMNFLLSLYSLFLKYVDKNSLLFIRGILGDEQIQLAYQKNVSKFKINRDVLLSYQQDYSHRTHGDTLFDCNFFHYWPTQHSIKNKHVTIKILIFYSSSRYTADCDKIASD